MNNVIYVGNSIAVFCPYFLDASGLWHKRVYVVAGSEDINEVIQCYHYTNYDWCGYYATIRDLMLAGF